MSVLTGSPLVPSLPLPPLMPGGPCRPGAPVGPGGPGGPIIFQEIIKRLPTLNCPIITYILSNTASTMLSRAKHTALKQNTAHNISH